MFRILLFVHAIRSCVANRTVFPVNDYERGDERKADRQIRGRIVDQDNGVLFYFPFVISSAERLISQRHSIYVVQHTAILSFRYFPSPVHTSYRPLLRWEAKIIFVDFWIFYKNEEDAVNKMRPCGLHGDNFGVKNYSKIYRAL